MVIQFRTEEEEKVLRDNDEKRISVKIYNEQEASEILKLANIDKDNPLYSKYYALTMANIHNANRFGVYNDKIQKMFIDTLKNPDLTIEQYSTASKQFKKIFAEKQLETTIGETFEDENPSYEKMKSRLNDTIISGIKMRKELSPNLPDVFYKNNTLKSRLYTDIPTEILEMSAMYNIKKITNEYNDFIDFDTKENKFLVDNQLKGPQEFFNHKIKYLERFNPETFDNDDAELFEIIKAKNFEKFKELKKNRGINREKRNISFINAIDDKFVFREICKSLKNKEINKDNIVIIIDDLKKQYRQKAEIVSKEAEKDTLDYIDTVMFSVSPYDLATQSTFRAWKSCMHMAGSNQKYVDDTIAAGSIIAYGFSSNDPQNMVSRLLIHPYTDKNGNIAYKVNNRIYGKDNLAFRKMVNMFVEEQLNNNKDGVFVFNNDKEKDSSGYLYYDNDNADNTREDILTIINYEKGDNIELSNYVQNNELILRNIDISLANDITLPTSASNIVLDNVALPKNLKKLDLSHCENLSISNMDLSNIDELILPTNIYLLKNVVLPKNYTTLDLTKSEYLKIESCDFSNVEHLYLPDRVKDIKNVTFPKITDLSNIKNLTVDKLKKANFSKTEELITPQNIKNLEWMKNTYNLKKLDLSYIEDSFSFEGKNLSNLEELIMPQKRINICANDTKFPKIADLKNASTIDIAGADFSNTKKLILPPLVNNWNDVKFNSNLKLLDLSNVLSNLANINLPDTEYLIPPETISSLDQIKLPNKLNTLDLSLNNYINISEKDLSNIGKLIAPKDIVANNTIFPKITDLRLCQNLKLERADFTNTEELKLPEKIKSFKNIKLPKNCTTLDLSMCDEIDISGTDFSNVETLILPSMLGKVNGTKFPKKIDLSHCNSNLEGADFTNTEHLILPKNCSNLEKIEISSKLQILDMSHIEYATLQNKDLSNLQEFIPPKEISYISNIKFPKKSDLSCCTGCIDYSSLDFSKTEELKLPNNFKNFNNIKLPTTLKVLDLSACKNVDLHNADLSNIQMIKLPPNYDKSQLPEGLYENNEVVRNAMYEINPNLKKIDQLRSQTKNRHSNDNKITRPIVSVAKHAQFKLRNFFRGK